MSHEDVLLIVTALESITDILGWIAIWLFLSLFLND